MKSSRARLIGLFSILAIAISALAVGYVMAQPSDAPSGAAQGTLTITGGFERLADKARFYSDKEGACAGGCNVVAVSVIDADLSKKRSGTVVYSGDALVGLAAGSTTFQVLDGNGISSGGTIAGVLQGETSASRTFTGDAFTVVYPLTTTGGNILNLTSQSTGGVSVIRFGPTFPGITAAAATGGKIVLDRNNDGAMTSGDVTFSTDSGVTFSNVTGVTRLDPSSTTTTADAVRVTGLTVLKTDNVAVATGARSAALVSTPADLNGDFTFSGDALDGLRTADIVSATLKFTRASAKTADDSAAVTLTGTTGDITAGGVARLGRFFGTSAGLTGSAIVTITYRIYSADLVSAATFKMAASLTDAQAKAAAGWNGKIPRDSGIAAATPGPNGQYDATDLQVVVAGKTLATADYTFDINTHLFTIIDIADTTNIPPSASGNVTVSYNYTEFNGSLVADSISTPFGNVTASAGPKFGTQEAIAVAAKSSLVGSATLPGQVRLDNALLNRVVKITFEYDVIDTATSLVSVGTPTGVGAGKSRTPTGTETTANSNTFTFKVGLLTLDEINTIDTTATATMTIAGLVAALPATGALNTRVNTLATNAGTGLGLAGTALASTLQALLVPIRDGEILTVTYTDADAGAGASGAVSKTATIDLKAPTLAINKPTDKSFAGGQTTLQVTVADGGAGLRLADVAANLRTEPLVIGSVVASSALGSAPEYSLSLTAGATSPIREGKTRMWVGTTQGNGIIRDAVGNQPNGSGETLSSDTATGTRGTSANPFEFTIDKAGPTLTRALTGGKLDTDPISATVNQIIADPGATDAITVELNLGIGGAPVDDTSVSPADFEVSFNPTVPVIDIIVGAVPTDAPTTQKLLLRLETPLPTDAKPTVKLVGTISDKAANPKTTVTLSGQSVVDNLKPVVTASIVGGTSGNPVGRDQVTVLVSSTEPGTITGTARYVLATADKTLLEDDANQVATCGKPACSANLSFTSTGTGTWEAVVKINSITNVSVASGLVNVRVTVTDDSQNGGTAGVADPDGTTARATALIGSTALVFELDNRLNNGVSTANDIFVLSPETGTATDHKTDSSDPFITVEFKGEANEYSVTGSAAAPSITTAIKVDTHADVDLTSAVLTLPDATTQDVLLDFKRSAANRFVMRASGLALGAYKLSIQGKDSQGNVSAKDVPTAPGKTTAVETFSYSFQVTERAKYTVSMVPGLNLVSIPGTPVNTDINSVIGATDPIDLVTTYDPTAALGPWLVATRNADTGLLEGTLTKIDAEHGYWVRASSFFSLNVELPLPALTGQLPPTLAVSAGWNLVPIVDLRQQAFGTEIGPEAYFTGVNWSLAYTFDTIGSAWIRIPKSTPAVTPDDVATTLGDAVQVGRGYWVFASEAGTIVP